MDNKLFKVFAWKNLLFLKSAWISSSVICSACFIILLIYLKSTYNSTTTPTFVYESKNIEDLKPYFPGNDGDFIFYSPTDLFLDELMDKVRMDLSLPTEKIKSFSNATSMVLTLESKTKANCFAVLFEKWPTSESKKSLRYSISSTMTKLSPKERFVNDKDANGIVYDDEYTRTGFLTLQQTIDLNFIKSATNVEGGFEVDISALPSIALETFDGQRVNTFGSLFAVLFNVLLLSTTLIPLVEEKHDGIKEFLVLATPLNFLNGLTFFCIRFLAYLPFIIGCVIIASAYQAAGLVPVTYLLILFFLYCCAAMCYTFLISVCFNSVFYAKVGGFLLLIIPYLFYLVGTKLSHVATKLFSTSTFLEGVDILQTFTNKHRVFTTRDLFLGISKDLPSMFSVLIVLLFQCLAYTILYNYLSRVFPGKGGLKQRPLFFLDPSFYRKKNRNQCLNMSSSSDDTAIIIQDLVKTFASKDRVRKVADRLNMEIKDRRINVLLGHNGAGKTTTLNMIIGSVPKDSGKIIVCSERDVATYRHLIGFCPQHSVFMQYMNCYQHLKFFAQLRGKSVEEASSLASELLTQLKLVDKAKECGRNLSGGMKRRLSLGIALAGDTKVVILDEPSSGLDVESRRELWDVLLQLRKKKAVLITTHHMEEAEVLGDTISILSNGKLEQTGSPLELKRTFGSGYILKLRTDGHFRQLDTMGIIQDIIPGAYIKNTVPPTVLISLPYSHKANYPEALEKLEDKKAELGISSITVTDTSLEDVFLNSQGGDTVDAPKFHSDASMTVPYESLIEKVSWTRQFQAIFYKKFVFIKSQWIYSLIMFSLPLLAIACSIVVMSSLASHPAEGYMQLKLDQLPGGYIFLKVAPELAGARDILKNEIESNGIEIRNLSEKLPVAEELLSLQSENVYDFYEHAIGAVVVELNENKPSFKILYSGNILHSSVILVNLIDNAIMKMETSVNASIETIYEPIQRRSFDINPSSLEYFAAIIPIGFFFYMMYYVSLPYLENRSGFKNLQAIPRATYWASFVAFDILLHTLVCVGCFVLQYAIMPSNLYGYENQVLLFFTYLFYGFFYLPILYCMTIGFRSISPLSTYLFFMFIVSAIVPFITSDNLQSMQNFETTIVFMSFLPDFSLNHQLRVINEHFFAHRRKVFSQSRTSSGQDLPSPYTFFVYAVILFFVIELFLIKIWDNVRRRKMLEEFVMCNRCRRSGRQSEQSFQEEDEILVKKEKEKVESISDTHKENDYPLIVQNLHKSYDRVHAVRDLNFAVKRQECFGLLGVNGAGKTSTFQMITANLPLSGGQIMIDGVSLLQQEDLYKYRFGYCPQGDCLNGFMTSYQILKYMALLRNVGRSDIETEVNYWLHQLDLSKYRNIPIRFYSGGTKRKLNAAIAMIGNPSLVLLDEPTTGVDPISRRFLWKCIQDFQKNKQTVVLTSHSMDECEYLCNRLAIMARGKLQCIGCIPDLKEKYGSGFTITIKLRSNCTDINVKSITSSLQEEFNCELREQHAGMLTYFIKEKSVKWSDVFRRTERFADALRNVIHDYSLNETTLEDIFLQFDKKT